MKNRLIPIYREVDQKAEGFTIMLDSQSWHVYKVLHEKGSNYKFWIAWALVLVLLRGVKHLDLSMESPMNILLVVALLGISGGIGVYKYKESHRNPREVYYTSNMVEEFIEKGKNTLKGDVILSIITFVVFFTFLVLFFIYQWLTLLFFVLLFFYLLIMLVCHLSPERFKLYSQRSK